MTEKLWGGGLRGEEDSGEEGGPLRLGCWFIFWLSGARCHGGGKLSIHSLFISLKGNHILFQDIQAALVSCGQGSQTLSSHSECSIAECFVLILILKEENRPSDGTQATSIFCICYLSLRNEIPQSLVAWPIISCFTVSVCQESNHSIAGSRGSGSLTRLPSR